MFVPKLNIKVKHRPLAAYYWISLSAFILHFIAFLLFLLVSLSIPIIKSLYLFIIDFKTRPNQPPTTIATDIRFGVWGFCASNVFDLPTIFTNDGRCTPTHLGYTVPEDLLDLTGFPEAAGAVVKALTVLLVLHPVCAILAFLAMFTSLFLSSKAMTIISLILSIALALVAGAVFAVDLAIEIIARNDIAPLVGPTVIVGWGNAVWLALIGVALTWVSVILLSIVSCRCCGYRKRKDDGLY
ncbi:pH-response regulator palI/RIM9 [Abortiporus biennis]